MVRSNLIRLLAILTFLACSAWADDYWVNAAGWAQSPGGYNATLTAVTGAGTHTVGTWAGVFTIAQSPNSSGSPSSPFQTICIDPLGGWPDQGWVKYSRTDSAGYNVDPVYVTETGVANSDVLENAIARLWSGVGGIGGLTTNIERAAFQSLAWEIMLDYSPTAVGFGDLGSGKLTMTFSGDQAAIYAQTQTWANNLKTGGSWENITPAGLRFWKDEAGIYQDFVDTPEPGFYGVLAIGLSALTIAVRRRRTA